MELCNTTVSATGNASRKNKMQPAFRIASIASENRVLHWKQKFPFCSRSLHSPLARVPGLGEI